MVADVLSGNTERYAELVSRHSGYVFRAVSVQVPEPDVEEIVQEAFVRGFSKLSSLRKPSAFRPWVTSIALRLCAEFWRREYRKRECIAGASEGMDVDRLPDLGGESSRNLPLDRLFLDAMFQCLDEDDRLVLNLLYCGGYTCVEIGDLLQWSESKVKVRAHRARNRLRDGFGSQWGPEGE